ncbi:MAG: EthD family reductase [Bacteroidota bacterium]
MNTKFIFLILTVITLLASCQEPASTEAPQTPQTPEIPATSKSEQGMVKVTIMYPNGEGNTFDMDYYSQKHMPMVASLLGDSMKMYTIDKGIAGRTPDEAVPFLAIGYLYFDRLSAYQNSFGPVAEQILGDIPNYTNVQPVLQISEVIK